MASSAWHLTKNLCLLATSLILLPLSTFIALSCTLYSFVFYSRSHNDSSHGLSPNKKTVLVTGVSMSKGLTIARHFHLAGHRVVGADVHTLSCARVSTSLNAFHVLPSPAADGLEEDDDPYIERLVAIVKNDKVDLWISVSDVNNAVTDARAMQLVQQHSPSCKVIQLPQKEIELLHEKDSFISHTAAIGLSHPDTQILTDKDSIASYLSTHTGSLRAHPDGKGKRYLVKPVGVDDVARFSMDPLPLASEEETLTYIDEMPFSPESKFIIQEFISGPEYCTYSLVVKGKVVAFTACPSSTVLMHYHALPPESPLFQAMLDFTKKQVASLSSPDISGHLSFDFLTKNAQASDGKTADLTLYPIECNPRVHTAIVLFRDTPALVSAYLSIFADDPGWTDEPLTPSHPSRFYWGGQDLVDLVLHPLYLAFFAGTMPLSQLKAQLADFADHLLHWKDGTFEVWDPWPWWWLYHVYWPVRFAGYLMRGKWHKINVSTGKAFNAQ